MTDNTTFSGLNTGDIRGLGPGTQLGIYELREPLGRGGMGEVWKAYDSQGDRFVATKILPHEFRRNQDAIEQVRAAFQVIHPLTHQNICKTIGLFEDPVHGPYIAMDFVQGIMLSKYVRDERAKSGKLSLDTVVKLLTPVATALDYAHQKGVLHRDIKPQNMIVVSEPAAANVDVILIDFGLAAEIRTTMTQHTQGKVDTRGTRPYMSPEQLRGKRQHWNGQTDQYSLAVVAYELLAGHPPFEGDDEMAMMLAIFNETADPIPGQPEHVNQTLLRGLAKENASRFPTCMDFIRALATAPQAVVSKASTGTPRREEKSTEKSTGPIRTPLQEKLGLAPVARPSPENSIAQAPSKAKIEAGRPAKIPAAAEATVQVAAPSSDRQELFVQSLCKLFREKNVVYRKALADQLVVDFKYEAKRLQCEDKLASDEQLALVLLHDSLSIPKEIETECRGLWFQKVRRFASLGQINEAFAQLRSLPKRHQDKSLERELELLQDHLAFNQKLIQSAMESGDRESMKDALTSRKALVVDEELANVLLDQLNLFHDFAVVLRDHSTDTLTRLKEPIAELLKMSLQMKSVTAGGCSTILVIIGFCALPSGEMVGVPTLIICLGIAALLHQFVESREAQTRGMRKSQLRLINTLRQQFGSIITRVGGDDIFKDDRYLKTMVLALELKLGTPAG